MKLAIDVGDAFRIALEAMRTHKLRGALTTLGIIIGIVAVITTMTAANGLQNTFRQSFSAVGTDVLYVSRIPWVVMNDFFLFRNRPPLELAQAEELEKRLRGRCIVNPTLDGSRDVKFQSDTIEAVTIIGTTEKHMFVSSASPETGRFLMPFEVTHRRAVCVVGSEIRDGLFGDVDPLNKIVKIGRTEFRIVGVMEKQGGQMFGGPNFDRQIFIPITSYVKAFGGARGGQDVNIAVKAPSQEALADLEHELIGAMRAVRGLRPSEPDDFSVNKLDTLVGAFNNVMGVVLLVGLLVTGISLFVGGVGVMNIMFVSVTERTREIGIRKALGARRRNILLQFLFEASTICLMGGLIGIVLASGVTAIINAALLPASVSPLILLVAVLLSVLIGLVAGVVPAWRGARLDPIEALRHE